jgi:hypothetical protein
MGRSDELLAELKAEAVALRRNTRVALVTYGVLIALSILSTTYTATQLQAETAPEVAAEQAAAIIEHLASQVRVDLIRDLRSRSANWPEQIAVAGRDGVAKLSAIADEQIAGFVETAVAPQVARIDPLVAADSAVSVDAILASVALQAPSVIRDAMSADGEQSAIAQARRKIAIYWLLSNDGKRATMPVVVLQRMADGLENLLEQPASD